MVLPIVGPRTANSLVKLYRIGWNREKIATKMIPLVMCPDASRAFQKKVYWNIIGGRGVLATALTEDPIRPITCPYIAQNGQTKYLKLYF